MTLIADLFESLGLYFLMWGMLLSLLSFLSDVAALWRAALVLIFLGGALGTASVPLEQATPAQAQAQPK